MCDLPTPTEEKIILLKAELKSHVGRNIYTKL